MATKNSKPQDIVAQLRKEGATKVEVTLEELILPAGIARRIGYAATLLVLPPIVPDVAALHLVARSRCAPEKARRKADGTGRAALQVQG